jgi:hypothetical protein
LLFNYICDIIYKECFASINRKGREIHVRGAGLKIMQNILNFFTVPNRERYDFSNAKSLSGKKLLFAGEKEVVVGSVEIHEGSVCSFVRIYFSPSFQEQSMLEICCVSSFLKGMVLGKQDQPFEGQVEILDK